MQRVDGMIGESVMDTTMDDALDVKEIAPPRHGEAARLAQVELDRFVSLAESLEAEDWTRPTACALWNVKQIVAHQADHCHWGPGGFAGLMRHMLGADLTPYRKQGMDLLDSSNQYAVERRAGLTSGELIAEMRELGPLAIRARQALTWPARNLIPFPATGSFGNLMDVILTRDMWMHRLDICRATGRTMVCSADHDGRIVALIMRDLGRHLRSKLAHRAVTFDLTGTAGGRWRAGSQHPGNATIRMDVLEFCVLNSGRITAQEVLNQPGVAMTGDRDFARFVLENSLVLY